MELGTLNWERDLLVSEQLTNSNVPIYFNATFPRRCLLAGYFSLTGDTLMQIQNCITFHLNIGLDKSQVLAYISFSIIYLIYLYFRNMKADVLFLESSYFSCLISSLSSSLLFSPFPSPLLPSTPFPSLPGCFSKSSRLFGHGISPFSCKEHLSLSSLRKTAVT